MEMKTPGYIQVTKESAYALQPDLDARIVSHIEGWRDSVETGTCVTIDKMLNCNSSCGCPADRLLEKCKGPRPGLPVEIVLDHLFPEGGSCAIEGVKGISDTTPYQIEKTA